MKKIANRLKRLIETRSKLVMHAVALVSGVVTAGLSVSMFFVSSLAMPSILDIGLVSTGKAVHMSMVALNATWFSTLLIAAAVIVLFSDRPKPVMVD